MPCWYYEKKELKKTPSVQDGIDYETECRYRKEGARFIIETGSKINLGYNTMATGVVYFHRFYMFHSFKNFPRYVTACCCLFLAGKVEETPKKCKDIIKTAKSLLSEQKFATFGEDPKEEVMTLERILLQTIKFDLQVEHPYSFLLKYAKCLKGEKGKLQKMVQMAWTFINDSLCTTLCLQWEPEIIAVALMYLAGKLSTFEVVDWNGRTQKHLRWWDLFLEDVEMDLLEGICHQVLDLYSPANNTESPDSPSTAPSRESIRERYTLPKPIDATLYVTPALSSRTLKSSTSSTPANGCSTVEIQDLQNVNVLQQFPPYAASFQPSGTNHPPVFPSTNINMPPPINHIAPPSIHHLATSGFVRSSLPSPTTPQQIQPYSYETNATYFPSSNPSNQQRGYYQSS